MALPESAAPPRRSPFHFMTAADWALIGLVTAVLFVLCMVRSRTRLLWADELYGYRVVGASTLPRMLCGWWQGADGGGIFYYLPARLWVRLFGLSELTLRLFSTAGMCLALALNWTAARRYFSTFVVALSVGFVYLTAPAMLWQEVNGRFYGDFLAAAALASLWFLVTAEQPLTRQDLAITTAAHAWLIGSHILGLVYSFSLILGMIAWDRFQHRTRWRLYLAAAAGWVMVPVSWHAIHASASIATTVFWTRRPALPDFLLGFAIFGRLTAGLLALLTLLAVARVLTSGATKKAVAPVTRSAAFVLIGSLVLAQGILFFKSQLGLSIYSDRYLLPMSLVTVLLFATLLTLVLPPRWQAQTSSQRAFLAGLAMLLPCCVYACSRDPNHALYPPRDYARQMAASLPHDAPILATLPAFTLLTRYDPTHDYLFSLNWHYDLGPGHPVLDYSGERLMENWRRAGYEAGHIQSCEQIFSTYPDVYLLLAEHQADWFEDRLRHNPAYQVQQIAAWQQWQSLTLWSVHRRAAGSLPC